MRILIFSRKTCKQTNFPRIFTGLIFLLFTIITYCMVNSAIAFAARNIKLPGEKLSKKTLSTKKLNAKKLSAKKLSDEILPNEKSDIFHIISDTMVSDKNAGFIEFSGNACATNKESVIKADAIKIFLYKKSEQKKTSKGKQQNIKKIIASGRVEYTSGNKKAFSDKAVYFTKNQIIVLTGKNPTVTMGDSFVTGKKITLFQKNSRVVVESGGAKRVEALFNSKDRIEKSKQ